MKKLIRSLFVDLPLLSIALTGCGSTGGSYHTVSFDTHGGSIVESQKVKHGQKAEKPVDPTRRGYSFTKWTYNDRDWSFVDDEVKTDITLDGNWKIINYSITYELNGGINSQLNPSTYTVETSFTFKDASKTGYTFLGWFNNDGDQVTCIEIGTVGNIHLIANWTPNLNRLSVTSQDENKGTVAITSGSGYSNESITVVATPLNDCVFKGWYHDDSKVCDEQIYSFIMPLEDYSLVAHFSTKQEEWNKTHGVIPVFSSDGRNVTYGLYPQTNIDDSSLLSELNSLQKPESNGWYLYENEFYAKTTATTFATSYKFDNGTTIVNGQEYWFKCEPIVWNVLSASEGDYFILSSLLLDAHCYYKSKSGRIIDDKTIYPNNYKYSDIRMWLNEDFYDMAFALGNSYIEETKIDNSPSTTNSTENIYACEDTMDKVFLPSYQDYLNSSYGFPSSTEATDFRTCKTTDWARARGSWCFNKNQNNYWTRSPEGMIKDCVELINVVGKFSYDGVDCEYHSVRPSIKVKM